MSALYLCCDRRRLITIRHSDPEKLLDIARQLGDGQLSFHHEQGGEPLTVDTQGFTNAQTWPEFLPILLEDLGIIRHGLFYIYALIPEIQFRVLYELNGYTPSGTLGFAVENIETIMEPNLGIRLRTIRVLQLPEDERQWLQIRELKD